MKHVFLPLLALLVTFSSFAQNTKAKSRTTGTTIVQKTSTTQPVSFAYQPEYSSQFAMGNPAYAQMILDMYKAYETNNFSGENRFADTAVFILSDGRLLRGAEAIGNALSQGRNSQSNPKFTISAVMAVRSVDQGQDWVLVWGSQTFDGAGSDNNNEFQSTWRINKDKKVDYVHIFEGKPPMQ